VCGNAVVGGEMVRGRYVVWWRVCHARRWRAARGGRCGGAVKVVVVMGKRTAGSATEEDETFSAW